MHVHYICASFRPCSFIVWKKNATIFTIDFCKPIYVVVDLWMLFKYMFTLLLDSLDLHFGWHVGLLSHVGMVIATPTPLANSAACRYAVWGGWLISWLGFASQGHSIVGVCKTILTQIGQHCPGLCLIFRPLLVKPRGRKAVAVSFAYMLPATNATLLRLFACHYYMTPPSNYSWLQSKHIHE